MSLAFVEDDDTLVSWALPSGADTLPACACCGGDGHDPAGFGLTADLSGATGTVADFTALLSFRGDGTLMRWNHVPGEKGDAGADLTIVTYSFRSGPDLPSGASLPYDGIRSAHAFTYRERQVARDVLDHFETKAGLLFVEVEAGGMLDLFTYSGGGRIAGYSYGADLDRGGWGLETAVRRSAESWSRTEWTATLLHEVGHRLGLKHPFEGDLRLDAGLDNRTDTVMSYSGRGSPELGRLDVAALRALYGDPGGQLGTRTIGTGIEVIGTAGNDSVSGVGGGNRFFGHGGDDLFLGANGADFLDGGAGDDSLHGGLGADTLLGGGGNDYLRFSTEARLVEGGAGDDVLQLAQRTDGYAFARAVGSLGIVDGGEGYDTVKLSGGQKISARTDMIFNNVEAFEGSAGRDVFDGDDRANRWFSVGGDDVVRSFGGNDTLKGAAGADTFEGGDGDDLLKGAAGNDTLSGQDGADILRGEGGDDLIYFDLADLRVDGGAGDDVFVLTGLVTTDDLTDPNPNLVIEGGEGTDILRIEAGYTHFAFDWTTVTFTSGIEFVEVSGDLHALV